MVGLPMCSPSHHCAPTRRSMTGGSRCILIVDPQGHSPAEQELAELFGLAPAEARLAAALLTGKKLAEIAAATGVQITTLRTQLGSVLRKVGAARQSDLVRILSGTGSGQCRSRPGGSTLRWP